MIDISGKKVDLEEIIFALKKDMDLKDVCYKVLHQRVIDEVARSRGITVTPEEIQAEADHLRHQFHLYRASDTLSWLAGQLVTVNEWEAGIRDRLLTQKLAENLFANEVPAYFAQNKVNFDQVVLYHLVVPYAPLAQELFYEIEEEEISFYEAAHLYDVDESRRLRCGYEGNISRWYLKPDLAAKIFGADPRKVLEPIPSESGYDLYMVEDFIPAKLTDQIYQKILNDLFQEWLEQELAYWLSHYSGEKQPLPTPQNHPDS